jgi:hypothetical protein
MVRPMARAKSFTYFGACHYATPGTICRPNQILQGSETIP